MRHRSSIIAAAAALALTASAALACGHGDDYGKKKTEKDMTTVKGDVQRIYTRTVDESEVLLIDVKTGDKAPVTVCLGSVDTAKRDKMDLDKGDKVTVRGTKEKRTNGDMVLVAHDLQHGDKKWNMKHDEKLHEKMM